jgi:7-cyano-7-deazaguanine synthase
MINRSRRAARKKAVVLLSGGLDSAVTLYIAKHAGFDCSCLIFDYGQRHRREIESAKRIARKANCPWQVLKIHFPWKGSALLDRNIKLPGVRSQESGVRSEIPGTYVPGRNIIFLSFALSFAEAIGAQAIYIGAHAQDYSGYPDCRAEFFRAFSKVISSGTKAGREKRRIEVKTPLINKTKSGIIRLGSRLNVPFALTWSCYQGDLVPCQECDSCYYREKGFREAGMKDPLLKT